MRRTVVLAVSFASLFAVSPRACVDPMSIYSVGVVFSDGAELHPERIEQAAQDNSCYIKSCSLVEASKGRTILEGNGDSCKKDPLTIRGVTVSLNSLNVEVQYGGGCGYHAIELYTNKALLKSNPAQLNVWLSHNGNGDNCEALISKTIKFDLASMAIDQELILHVYAPGASEAFTDASLWTPVSGQKTEQCAYKLRSAYADNVMAYVGHFSGPFQNGNDGFRVLLVFDTASVPPAATKAAAMTAELNRLAAIGVLSPEASFIDRVSAALAIHEGQYWAGEDSVLPFNMWFDGAEINGVKGVYGARGCGSGVTYDLPEARFEPVTGTVSAASMRTSAPRMSAVSGPAGISVRMAPVNVGGAVVMITDMHGRELARQALRSGATGCTLQGTGFTGSAGFYVAAVIHGGRTIQACAVTASVK